MIDTYGQPSQVIDALAPTRMLVFESGGYAYGVKTDNGEVLSIQSGDPAGRPTSGAGPERGVPAWAAGPYGAGFTVMTRAQGY